MLYTIRDAAPDDAERLAGLHVETFRETHGGGPSVATRHEQWNQILGQRDPRDFTFIIENDRGELVGFARGTPHDGGVAGYEGTLNKIYVLRRCHGHGLGRLLVCAVARRFLSQGVESMLLFGDARSRSNGFYEHLGAERLLSPEGEFHGGYGWRDLAALVRHCEAERAATSAGIETSRSIQRVLDKAPPDLLEKAHTILALLIVVVWVRYRQLFPWFFGDPGTMGRVVFLVFLGLSITAFAGLLLRRGWGFFAFYAAVVFATIMLALSFIPIPLTFLPARHRWIGMTLLNLIALLAGVFIQRRMRMTGDRTE